MNEAISVAEVKDFEDWGTSYPLEPQYERALSTIKELTLQIYESTNWRQWEEMPEWLQEWMEYHGADLFWKDKTPAK